MKVHYEHRFLAQFHKRNSYQKTPGMKTYRSAAILLLVSLISGFVPTVAIGAVTVTHFGYSFESSALPSTFTVVAGHAGSSAPSLVAAVNGQTIGFGAGLQFNSIVEIGWGLRYPLNGLGDDLAVFTVNAASGLPKFYVSLRDAQTGSLSGERLISFDDTTSSDVGLSLLDFSLWGVGAEAAISAIRLRSLGEYENIIPGGNAAGVNPSYVELVGALNPGALNPPPQPVPEADGVGLVAGLMALGMTLWRKRVTNRRTA